MEVTRVVNLRDESYDAYIGRAGRGEDGYFGNPFPLVAGVTREEVLEKYRAWFLDRVDGDPTFRSRALALRGKTLGCFCKPFDCHGDVIKEWLDGLS